MQQRNQIFNTKQYKRLIIYFLFFFKIFQYKLKSFMHLLFILHLLILKTQRIHKSSEFIFSVMVKNKTLSIKYLFTFRIGHNINSLPLTRFLTQDYLKRLLHKAALLQKRGPVGIHSIY
jgi:hypothetical protein